MPLAEDTLARLLARGERAHVGGATRAVRESFTDLQGDYWRQPLEERDRMHAQLVRAEAAGAISLTWARHGGDDRPLASIALKDLDRLAAYLRVPTASSVLEQARQTLAPWQDRTRVRELLSSWDRLKKVRGTGPEGAGDYADALRVIDAVGGDPVDRLARPLSVELFGRSKRLEALYVPLDVLTADALGAPARHWSEVLGALGIRKEPQPLLLAGGGELTLLGTQTLRIARPFLGVANHAVRDYKGAVQWILSVENLTTFHQCAELLSGADHGLIVYTGGMPSPSWVRAYRRLLAGAPASAAIYHWGDHDEGGFRIAAYLASVCRGEARCLQPWQMHADRGEPAPLRQRNAMAAAARRAGWDALAQAMPAWLLEQESQLPVLPTP